MITIEAKCYTCGTNMPVASFNITENHVEVSLKPCYKCESEANYKGFVEAIERTEQQKAKNK